LKWIDLSKLGEIERRKQCGSLGRKFPDTWISLYSDSNTTAWSSSFLSTRPLPICFALLWKRAARIVTVYESELIPSQNEGCTQYFLFHFPSSAEQTSTYYNTVNLRTVGRFHPFYRPRRPLGRAKV
jgi:hypothetical protein